MSIMIVDDSSRVRAMLRLLLARLGHPLFEFEDGLAAVAAYPSLKPQCVVMDIRMPRLDGLAAARQIIALHPAARIIIVSDYVDPEMQEAARAAGARAFL